MSCRCVESGIQIGTHFIIGFKIQESSKRKRESKLLYISPAVWFKTWDAAQSTCETPREGEGLAEWLQAEEGHSGDRSVQLLLLLLRLPCQDRPRAHTHSHTALTRAHSFCPKDQAKGSQVPEDLTQKMPKSSRCPLIPAEAR